MDNVSAQDTASAKLLPAQLYPCSQAWEPNVTTRPCQAWEPNINFVQQSSTPQLLACNQAQQLIQQQVPNVCTNIKFK